MKRGLIPYVDKEQTSKYLFQMAKLLENGCYQQEMLLRAVHIIDEALEQESILDKIRAEIEGYKSTIDKSISEDELKIEGMKEAYADCLDIIDKYKAESVTEK